MFCLAKRQLIRGCQAHINAGLGCGADYVASTGTALFAPKDGTISKQYTGNEGGKWLWFTDKDGNSLQFAHLSEYVGGLRQVKEGDLIAKTGNTGSITTGPHLHVQILKNNVRLDPEKYQWDTGNMSEDELLRIIKVLEGERDTVLARLKVVEDQATLDKKKADTRINLLEDTIRDMTPKLEIAESTVGSLTIERDNLLANMGIIEGKLNASQALVTELDDKVTVLTRERNTLADQLNAKPKIVYQDKPLTIGQAVSFLVQVFKEKFKI